MGIIKLLAQRIEEALVAAQYHVYDQHNGWSGFVVHQNWCPRPYEPYPLAQVRFADTTMSLDRAASIQVAHERLVEINGYVEQYAQTLEAAGFQVTRVQQTFLLVEGENIRNVSEEEQRWLTETR